MKVAWGDAYHHLVAAIKAKMKSLQTNESALLYCMLSVLKNISRHGVTLWNIFIPSWTFRVHLSYFKSFLKYAVDLRLEVFLFSFPTLDQIAFLVYMLESFKKSAYLIDPSFQKQTAKVQTTNTIHHQVYAYANHLIVEKYKCNTFDFSCHKLHGYHIYTNYLRLHEQIGFSFLKAKCKQGIQHSTYSPQIMWQYFKDDSFQVDQSNKLTLLSYRGAQFQTWICFTLCI